MGTSASKYHYNRGPRAIIHAATTTPGCRAVTSTSGTERERKPRRMIKKKNKKNTAVANGFFLIIRDDRRRDASKN